MVNYLHHLQQLLLLLLLGMLAISLAHEDHQSDALHRSKRTLTTICVEIKPSGPQEEPYFMCRGTDFSRGNNAATATATATAAADQPQPMPNYAQPAGQAMPINPQYASAPFPSFPSFGAGFLPILPSYEEAPKAPTYQSQTPAVAGVESQFGSSAAAIAPGPAAQSYGLPAVPYPAAAGPAAANRGTAVGPSAAPAPPPYAIAAPPKPTTAAHKSQPATSNGNSYDPLVGSRYRIAPDDDVMKMPDLGFRREELQRRPMEPMVGAAPPMIWLQRPQQLPLQYEDDPVMRTFYASQEHYDPQVAQAAPMEQLVGQAAPAYAPVYPAAPPMPAVVAPPQPSSQPQPPAPAYTENPRASSAPDGNNACNSCNRPCSTLDSYNAVPAHCPSFQPVIIAMPCYGQQQPTHYLAVPGSGAAAPQREQMLGSAYGAPFGMARPGMGSTFGMSPHFAMSSPQVGSSFGMGSQVGAPFGMAPLLNPFGPFGNLNPFNPFNRILGAAAPTTQQPRMRLFGAPEEATTATTVTSLPATLFPKSFTLNFSSSTLAPPTKISTEPNEATVGAARDSDGNKKDKDDEDDDDNDDEEEEEEETGSQEVTDAPRSSGTTEDADASLDAEVSKSLESKNLSADQLLNKGENKLKVDKRKRQNSRYSSNNNSQKRKYLQRL